LLYKRDLFLWTAVSSAFPGRRFVWEESISKYSLHVTHPTSAERLSK